MTSPAIASTMEPIPHAATPLVTPVVVKPEAEIILSAGMPKVQSYALPLDELAQIAQQSGLNWVNSDVAKVAAAQEESESNVDDGLLDINRASVADFMTLPGIGQSKAEALFQYREAHGRFSSIEEIMNVDGIKEGVFNKIKDSIKV